MMLFYEVYESIFIRLILSPFITDHKHFKIVLFIDVGWQYFFIQHFFRRSHDVAKMVRVSYSSWISSFFMISCHWTHRSLVRIIIVVVVKAVIIINLDIVIVKAVGFIVEIVTLFYEVIFIVLFKVRYQTI